MESPRALAPVTPPFNRGMCWEIQGNKAYYLQGYVKLLLWETLSWSLWISFIQSVIKAVSSFWQMNQLLISGHLVVHSLKLQHHLKRNAFHLGTNQQVRPTTNHNMIWKVQPRKWFSTIKIPLKKLTWYKSINYF